MKNYYDILGLPSYEDSQDEGVSKAQKRPQYKSKLATLVKYTLSCEFSLFLIVKYSEMAAKAFCKVKIEFKTV